MSAKFLKDDNIWNKRGKKYFMKPIHLCRTKIKIRAILGTYLKDLKNKMQGQRNATKSLTFHIFFDFHLTFRCYFKHLRIANDLEQSPTWGY